MGCFIHTMDSLLQNVHLWDQNHYTSSYEMGFYEVIENLKSFSRLFTSQVTVIVFVVVVCAVLFVLFIADWLSYSTIYMQYNV